MPWECTRKVARASLGLFWQGIRLDLQTQKRKRLPWHRMDAGRLAGAKLIYRTRSTGQKAVRARNFCSKGPGPRAGKNSGRTFPWEFWAVDGQLWFGRSYAPGKPRGGDRALWPPVHWEQLGSPWGSNWDPWVGTNPDARGNNLTLVWTWKNTETGQNGKKTG